MSNQQEAENERYAASLEALAECIRMGVSEKSMAILRFELAINRKDFIKLQYDELKFLEEKLTKLKGHKNESI